MRVLLSLRLRCLSRSIIRTAEVTLLRALLAGSRKPDSMPKQLSLMDGSYAFFFFIIGDEELLRGAFAQLVHMLFPVIPYMCIILFFSTLCGRPHWMF